MQTICSRHSIKFPFQTLPVNINAPLFTTLEPFSFTPCHPFFTSSATMEPQQSLPGYASSLITCFLYVASASCSQHTFDVPLTECNSVSKLYFLQKSVLPIWLQA